MNYALGWKRYAESDPKPEKYAGHKLRRRFCGGPLEAGEEDTRMAKKARSEEQILRALHQAESGERVADICREHGVDLPRESRTDEGREFGLAQSVKAGLAGVL